MPKEKDIFAIDIPKCLYSTKELTSKLTELHEALKQLEQDVLHLPPKLKSFASSLITHKLLNHSDRTVKLLAGCCMCDILRVFAPEAPFSNADTIVVFEGIVALLRGLANHDSTSQTGIKLFYILNSLSTVKSCVVPVILTQSGVLGASDVVISLLNALISSIRPTHGEEVLNHINDIIQACIDECDIVDQDILEILLQPLLPGPKVDNPIAYKLMCNILKNSEADIKQSFISFANNALVGSGSSSDNASELTEHLYPLIFEMHKACPALIVSVMPNICLQLQVDEEDIRLKATKLLGLLFASTYAEYGEECPRNFREFLGRFQDKALAIRVEMVEACSIIMTKKKSLRKYIEDAEFDVRSRVVKVMIDLALEDPNSLRQQILDELTHRFTDKRFEIRKMVMVGLSKVYHRHVSTLLPSLNNESSEANLDSYTSQETWEKLKSIPSLIVKCWGYEDFPTRHLAIQLFQECLLPKVSKSKIEDEMDLLNENDTIQARRATTLHLIFNTFDDVSRQSFKSMINFKTRVRIELESFLQLQQQIMTTKSSGIDNVVEQASLRKRMMNINQLIPSNDRKTSVLEALSKMKDKTIFRRLASAVSPSASVSDILAHKEDVKQRVDSKSSLGEYVGAMFDCSSFLIVNEDVMSHLLTYCISLIRSHSQAIKSHETTSHKRRKGPIDSYFSSSQGDKAPPKVDALFDLLEVLTKHASMSCSNMFGLYEDCLQEFYQLGSLHDEGYMTWPAPLGILLSRLCQVIDHAMSALARNNTMNQDSNNGLNLTAIHQAISLSKKLLTMSTKMLDPQLCEKFVNAGTRCIVGLLEHESVDMFKDEIIKNISPLIKSMLSRPLIMDENNVFSSTCSLIIVSSLIKIPLSNATSVKNPKLSMVLALLSKTDYKSHRKIIIESLDKGLLFAQTLSDDPDMESISDETWRLFGAGLQCYATIIATEVEIESNYPSEYEFITHKLKSHEILKDLVRRLFLYLDNQDHPYFYHHSVNTTVRFKNNNNISSYFNLEEVISLLLFDLLRLSYINKRLTIPQWHRLGWTLLNEDPAIRQSIYQKYCHVIQTCNIPPQYLSYLCLLANDDSLKVSAESIFNIVMKHLRVRYDELCSHALSTNNQELRQLAEEYVPEIILPYVIHLLSYHPDFPSSALIESNEDKRKVFYVIKCMKLVLRVLLQSIDTMQHENISYLLKQVISIESSYYDKFDEENIGIQFISRITIKLLKECIQTIDNIQIYPGEIYLPQGLFALKEKRSQGLQGDAMNPLISPISTIPSRKDESGMMGLDMNDFTTLNDIETSDRAIENVLSKVGKGIGKIPLKSAIGRHGTGTHRDQTMKSSGRKQGIEKTIKTKRGKKIPSPKKYDEDEREEEGEMKEETEEPTIQRRSRRFSDEKKKNYQEVDENDEEVQEWEEMAAHKQVDKSTTQSTTITRKETKKPQSRTESHKEDSLSPSHRQDEVEDMMEEAKDEKEGDIEMMDVSQRLIPANVDKKSKSDKEKRGKRPLEQRDINQDDKPSKIRKQEKHSSESTASQRPFDSAIDLLTENLTNVAATDTSKNGSSKRKQTSKQETIPPLPTETKRRTRPIRG